MFDNKKILIADSEIKADSPLKLALEEKGYEIALSQDGASALNKAISETPALIIMSISISGIDGVMLSQMLRTNARTEEIPLIYLSESDIQIPHFQRHKDCLFIKPVNIYEVVSRIGSIFNKIKRTREVSREEKIIEGALSEISLPDLLPMFSMNRKEGRLFLTGEKDKGEVLIQEGNIIDAVIGEIDGEKAMYRLLTWRTGSFKFMPSKVTAVRRIHRATDNLIMEGLRQLDEWDSLKEKFPPMDACLKILIDPSTLPKGLRPITQEILQLLEFYPRVSEILDRNTFPDYEVMRTILTLLSKGIIGIAREKESEDRPVLPREDVLRLKERSAIRRNYKLNKEFGKVLIFSNDNDQARYMVNSINALPGFHIHKDFLKGSASDEYLGVAGHLHLSDNARITFIVVPLSDLLSPLWRPLSNDMLCGLTILTGKSERWDEINKISKYFHGTLGRPMAFAVTEGEATTEKAREVRERLDLKSEVMLFNIIKNDTEGVRNMLSSLFRSVIGDV